MVGNMATPEAAHFVQTFVSTVLLGQRKMLYQLEMTYDSIWISLLENYYSILHNEPDLRNFDNARKDRAHINIIDREKEFLLKTLR